MGHISRFAPLFAWTVGGLGLACLVVLGIHLPMAFAELVPTFGLAVLAGVFERLTLTLPNRIAFSLGSLFVFLAYGRHGVAAAALVQVAEAVASSWNAKRPMKMAFNFGQLMLSLAVFHLVNRLFGTPAPFSAQGILVWLGGGLAYYGVNLLLVACVIHLSAGLSLKQTLRELLKDGYIGIAGALVLVLPLLYVFQENGWVALILVCAGLLGFRYAVNLYLQQKEWSLDSIRQLTELLERKTGAAEHHALRVALLAQRVAQLHKLPPDVVDAVYAAGLLHDVGEAEIEPRIVALAARKTVLTLADVEAYQRHPQLGAHLVSALPGMEPVAAIIRHHHEAWDGSGYPDGLAGEQIPYLARIVAAAEALASTAEEEAAQLAQVEMISGKVIDPALAPALTKAIRSLKRSPLPMANPSAGERGLPQGMLQAIQGSRFVEQLGLARIFAYAGGEFTNLLGAPGEVPSAEEVHRLIKRSLSAQRPVRQVVIDGDTALDAYVIPTGPDSVNLLLFDVTAALHVERDQVRSIFRAYRDVIQVATQGKLLLIGEEERNRLLEEGDEVGSVPLTQIGDGATARALVSQVGRECGLHSAELFRLTVCASEAFSNVFKHAGRGAVSVRLHEGTLRIVVRDEGPGISFETLPHAILLEGFSTQRSLGKGFTLLLRFLDRVLLCTSPHGTTTVLEYAVRAEPEPGSRSTAVGESPLQVHAESEGSLWLVGLAGEFAAESVRQVDLLQPPTVASAARLDLSGLTFIDSTGIGGLLRLALRCQAAGLAVELSSLSPNVAEMLELIGFFDVLAAHV